MAAKKSTAKKSAPAKKKGSAPKKSSAKKSSAKKSGTLAKGAAMTQSAIEAHVAEKTGLSRAQVKSVFTETMSLAEQQLKSQGIFKVFGVKLEGWLKAGHAKGSTYRDISSGETVKRTAAVPAKKTVKARAMGSIKKALG